MSLERILRLMEELRCRGERTCWADHNLNFESDANAVYILASCIFITSYNQISRTHKLHPMKTLDGWALDTGVLWQCTYADRIRSVRFSKSPWAFTMLG